MSAEIEFARYLAGRVLAHLVSKYETIFPSTKKPWYQATDEDVPK
jgi:hypothetical protein